MIENGQMERERERAPRQQRVSYNNPTMMRGDADRALEHNRGECKQCFCF